MISTNKTISLFNQLMGFLFGLCIFLLCQPYFAWDISGYRPFTMALALLISLLYIRKLNNYDPIILTLLLLFIIYTSNAENIFGYTYRIMVFVFLLIRYDKLTYFLLWFKRFFVVSLVLSLLVYGLVLIINVPLEQHYLEPLNPLKNRSFVSYPFLVSAGQLGVDRFSMRFFGMFDEPGVVGSIVAILLVGNHYNFRSWQNIILFIAGIFSFSLFFYIISFIYLVFFKSYRFILFLLLTVVMGYIVTKENPKLNKLIWERITVEEGKLKGDNRTWSRLEKKWDELNDIDDLIFGKGKRFTWNEDLRKSSSYKLLVLNFGYLALAMIITGFFMIAWLNLGKWKYLIMYMFLFVGMLYQRPGFVYNPALFYLLLATIFSMKLQIKSEKKIRIRSFNPKIILQQGG